jgi:hypothetical protein
MIVCVLAVWLVGWTVSAVAGTPCVVPDNGTGTPNLPPIGCDYTTPGDVFRIIDGLPLGTTIELEGTLMNLYCPNQPCSLCSLLLAPGECETLGGSLGGHGHCFDADLELVVTGTGSLAGFNRVLLVPVCGEVHTAMRNPGDPVQAFPTVFYRFFGELFGDPHFCDFRIKWGTDYNLPSPGHTTLTDLGNGTFNVDSFFDITYQIEFEGCPMSPIEDFNGTTIGTIRMATGFEDGWPCEPRIDGSACLHVDCNNPGDECQPNSVNFNPATGEIIVLGCECRGAGQCYVDSSGASVYGCMVPDNGTGTPTLPPLDCDYTSPNEVFRITEGLPEGTTIELDGILMDFFCDDQPCAICSLALPAGTCEKLGGSLGGHGHCFDATLDLTVTGTGSLASLDRHIAVPVCGEVHTAMRNPGDPVQDFNSVFFRFFGELFGDPDFCEFRIRWGTDYNLPSPGHMTLTQLSNGDFAVDSFFDITYQIEFEGCPGGELDGYSGTTTATIRIETGSEPIPPSCVGDCPPGITCEETVTVNPDGTVDVSCECVVTTCMPTPDGTACEPVACPNTSHECHAVCVNFDMATGDTTILRCECGEPNDCRSEILSPSSQTCVLPDNNTGTVTLPPIGCEYICPNEPFKIIDGLPPGTTIEMDGILMDFICCDGPSECSLCSLTLGAAECETTGGSLGGDGHCFTATLDLTVSGTGTLTSLDRHLAVPVFGEVHTAARNAGDPVQAFVTDFYRLDGELFGDPDFCEFIVTWGTDYSLASPGHTTLTQLPTGDFAVDSFFDITYQIEFEGCPGSELDGYTGTTTETLRMRAGGPLPGCIGDCPPWMVCDRTMTADCDDGTLKICCKSREPSADLNRDGIVNFKDFVFMANQWLRTIP